MSNPFIERGRITRPEHFTGRWRELSIIAERLEARRPVMLLGAPGAGKSSLLTHLSQAAAAILDRPDLRAYYVDCAALSGAPAFYRLVSSAIDKRSAGESVAALELALATCNHPLLLCLDNGDAAISAGWGEALIERLTRMARSSAAARNGGIALAGSIDLLLVVGAGSTAPLLSETLTTVSLGALGPSEARMLVEAYIDEDDDVRFSSDEIIELLRLSAGHPGYFQRAAYQLYAARSSGEGDWRAAYLSEARERPIIGAPLPPEAFEGIEIPRTIVSLRDLVSDAARPDRPRFEIDNADETLGFLLLLAAVIVVLVLPIPWWIDAPIFAFGALLLWWRQRRRKSAG